MWQHGGLGADSSLPQFLHDPLQAQTGFANLFQTGFDQTNPFPFAGQRGDTAMTESLNDNGADKESDE